MAESIDKLSIVTKFGYGTGHIMNDMAASLGFTYLMLFFQNVVRLHPVNSGLIVLVGQVANGIGAVIVGILSDKEIKIPLCLRYGKRKVILV